VAQAAVLSPARTADVTVGQSVPKFSIDSVNGGGTIKVPSGRPMLIGIFAFESGGNRAAMNFQANYARYASRGLDVVALSHDAHRDDVIAGATRYSITLPVAWDEGRKVVDLFKPRGVMSVFIPKRASALYEFARLGPDDGRFARLESALSANPDHASSGA